MVDTLQVKQDVVGFPLYLTSATVFEYIMSPTDAVWASSSSWLTVSLKMHDNAPPCWPLTARPIQRRQSINQSIAMALSSCMRMVV